MYWIIGSFVPKATFDLVFANVAPSMVDTWHLT